MLRRSFVAFDYYVANLTTASPTYCSTGYFEALGSADYLDVSVCIDRLTGTGGFDLFIEHSCDGMHFLTANGKDTVLGNGDASFAAGTMSTTSLNYTVGKAGYKFPLMAFVRLRFSMGNAGMQAHIYAVAQLRDKEKSASKSGQQHQPLHLHRTPVNQVQRKAEALGKVEATTDEIVKSFSGKGDG